MSPSNEPLRGLEPGEEVTVTGTIVTRCGHKAELREVSLTATVGETTENRVTLRCEEGRESTLRSEADADPTLSIPGIGIGTADTIESA